MPTLQLTAESRRAAWTLHMTGGRPEDFGAPEDMRQSIVSLERLPPLPEMARRILALKNDPYSDARKLADIVELDPPLAAQLVRWAASPLYGIHRKSLSVKDAIVLAIGFERAFELAFALCSLAPMQAPVEGPMGKRFFWRQTLAGSLLIQRLAHRATPAVSADPAELHLLYLLHNTGHLLLAHLFRHDFDRLARIAEANPAAALHSLERYVLGVDHCQLGAWLMQSWNLSERLVTVVQHHHNPCYRGEHERLVWLTCLTDRLLGHIGVGDAQETRWNEACLLENLGIAEDVALACLQAVEEKLTQLDGAVAGLI